MKEHVVFQPISANPCNDGGFGGFCRKHEPNPTPYAGPRDPVDPKGEAMVRLRRYGATVTGLDGLPVAPLVEELWLLESTEVVDGATQKRMVVGRIAARYDANSSLTVLHNGKQWRVETWREQAMRWRVQQ